MNNISYLPILLEIYGNLEENEYFTKYTENCFAKLGVIEGFEFVLSLITIHLAGFEYLAHYQEVQGEVSADLLPLFCMFKAKEIKEALDEIKTSMPTWKLLLLQKRLITEQAPAFLDCREKGYRVIDIDWTTLPSHSKLRQGANVGENKKKKGDRCYQLSLCFFSNIFLDMKLLPGDAGPKSLFRKHIKRLISLGYYFDVVRGDTAYGNAININFLKSKKLHYVLGAGNVLKCVSEGVKLFKQLSNKGSNRIISVHKGLRILDLGEREITDSETKEKAETRVIICCRIQKRRIKGGKWKTKYYFYAILTDLDWSIAKVVKFYLQRQKIENAIKELKYHYSLSRMPRRGIKANEFFIVSKILTMTLVKCFMHKYLPKRLVHMRLRTLLRKFFQHSLISCSLLKYATIRLSVGLPPKNKFNWHLKRIVKKLNSYQFQRCDTKNVA